MNPFIQEAFGIFPMQSFKLRHYDAYYDGQNLFILIKVYENEQQELLERYEMINYLTENGERFIPVFYSAQDGNFVKQNENDFYVLLKLEQWRQKTYQFPGRRLAIFHQRGANFQTEKNILTRVGKWKELWEKRIGHLESFWQQVVMNRPINEFERFFVESFPYYSGLTENAIQYYVDTVIDEQPQENDLGTICHERFTGETWDGSFVFKNPFDWVVDHHSRDLAEWIRHSYLSNSHMYSKPIQKFLHEYQTQSPLSPFAWRLLFSRLVLPIHYFQCIETYHSRLANPLDIQLLRNIKDIVDQTDEFEKFLSRFYEMANVPVQLFRIPQLDWLK